MARTAAIWASTALIALIAASPALAGSCQDIAAGDIDFTVCAAKRHQDLRLFLNDVAGKPFGNFAAVDQALDPQGLRLAFAMNAGMYHPDRSPVGLYVEGGKQVTPLVESPGPGNFGLQPNGVFCVSTDRFSVIETAAFGKSQPSCSYASQSGPMLVINGALHPKFLTDSDSLYIRNGVGVSADGQTAYFVISNEAANFHDFASFFRDELKTPNALFFDGHISRLYAPELSRNDFGFSMGPIVGLVVPKN